VRLVFIQRVRAFDELSLRADDSAVRFLAAPVTPATRAPDV
jgi:hypothetical protein